MPLYKTITVNSTTKVLIWKIEESFEALSEGIELTTHCTQRVLGMKSDIHRRGFMSIRHLLAIEGYTDFDLFYDENGKPHLIDGTHISITHSFQFSAIIISDVEIGIDIEKQRQKIIKIAHKFTPLQYYEDINDDAILLRKLTIVWCAKESLYKSFAVKGISFIQNIYVEDFTMQMNQTTSWVSDEGKEEFYDVWFEEFEGFTIAYALIKPENA